MNTHVVGIANSAFLGHHGLEELAQLNHVSSLLQDFAGLFVVAVLFVTIIIFSVLNLTLIAM
jgi:hypothetical protein